MRALEVLEFATFFVLTKTSTHHYKASFQQQHSAAIDLQEEDKSM